MTLKLGDPCRYGHPWNREQDQKKCLTCYPGLSKRPKIVADSALADARRALSEVKKKAMDAASALKKERGEALAAEISARIKAKERRLAELVEARQMSAELYRRKLAKLEADREERRRVKEEREAGWAARRRALTHAEQKDRERRNKKKRGDGWLRQSGYRAELWAEQQGRCGLTGAPIPSDVVPHLDHIVAKSKGGATVKSNLQWVHPMANHAKNSHTVEEFREWLLAAAEALKQKMQLEELL